MSQIVRFYKHKSPDYLGRWLTDIWSWNHEQLETTHSYIQVVFPNREPSPVTPDAPILDGQTEEAFHDDVQLKMNLDRSFELMLDFYGLRTKSSGEIERNAQFSSRSQIWLTPFNHNYLRITRMLLCLKALGLPDRAKQFHECLTWIVRDFPDQTGQETKSFWDDAISL